MEQKIEIIAEIGVNHNGNINIAKKLIRLAKIYGADYVKFQSFKTENTVQKNAKLANYQRINNKDNSQFNLLKKLELDKNSHKIIINFAKKNKIKFLSSPFDIESLKILKSLGINSYKIASGEINNFPLLELISKYAKKIFISTGMSTLKEINDAIKILTQYKLKKNNITVLHCTTDYPAKDEEANLLAMQLIKEKFQIKIGYSDHTIGNEASIIAAALGAKVIEKHFTLNKNLKGPDHKTSLNPKEFKDFVSIIRKSETLLGKKKKFLTKSEKKNKKFIRKSIVAKVYIKKGEKFTLKNITFKRPEGGIPPNLWKTVLKNKAKNNIKPDNFIKL
jgi:N,N'-diacetyllegionaminate synthase